MTVQERYAASTTQPVSGLRTRVDETVRVAAAMIACAIALAGAALAQPQAPGPDEDAIQMAPRQMAPREPDPRNLGDGAWMTISGRVTAQTAESFSLDYGDNEIRVEMDDWDAFPESYRVEVGDRVVVSGFIDSDFLERRSIEASSVYVDRLQTHFFANPTDEEGSVYLLPRVFDEGDLVTMTGTIIELDGDDLTLKSGRRTIEVNAGNIDNPLDDGDRRRIDVGDRVTVYGHMDDADLLDDREIEAIKIVELATAARTDER